MTRGARLASRRSTVAAVAAVGDVAIAVAAFDAAFFLRTHVALPGTETLLPSGSVRFTFGNVVIVAAVQALCLWYFGLYRDHERFRESVARRLAPALLVELITLASIYFLGQPYSFPRSVLVVYVVFNGLLLALWRAALDRLFPAAAAARADRRNRRRPRTSSRRRFAATPGPASSWSARSGRPRTRRPGSRSSAR